MGDDDRETILFHGTTVEVARNILATRGFEQQSTFFAPTKELAMYFAHRACGRTSNARRPAVVKVPLYEADLDRWTRNRLVDRRGFDEGDRPELRGQTQLIFSAEAVRLLNAHSFTDEWTVETG